MDQVGAHEMAAKIRARFDAYADGECVQKYAEMCYWAHKALGREDAPITDEQKDSALDGLDAAIVAGTIASKDAKAAAERANQCAAYLRARGWVPVGEITNLPPDAA